MKPDMIAVTVFTGGMAAQCGGLYSNIRWFPAAPGGDRLGGQRPRNFQFRPAYFPLVNKLRGGPGKGMA